MATISLARMYLGLIDTIQFEAKAPCNSSHPRVSPSHPTFAPSLHTTPCPLAPRLTLISKQSTERSCHNHEHHIPPPLLHPISQCNTPRFYYPSFTRCQNKLKVPHTREWEGAMGLARREKVVHVPCHRCCPSLAICLSGQEARSLRHRNRNRTCGKNVVQLRLSYSSPRLMKVGEAAGKLKRFRDAWSGWETLVGSYRQG